MKIGDVQMRFPLKWLLFNRWIWITISGMSAILIGPFIVIYVILTLPLLYRGLAIIVITIGWGIAAGHKDWIKSKHQEEKLRIRS